MLATVLYWTTLIILASRMKVSWQCAATAASNPPNPPTTSARDVQERSTESATVATTTAVACGTCQHLPVRRTDNNSRAVTQTDGTGTNSCPTVTVMCDGNATDAAVILTWYDSNGMDVGNTFGSGSVMAVLQCSTNSTLLLQNGVVNEVECLSNV